MSENDRLLRADQVEGTHIRVRETGKPVTLRSEFHARTNHYIKESRPYFPNTKLRTYIDCPCFLRLATFIFCVSVCGPVIGVIVEGLPMELPLAFFIVSAIFFGIYCQHEWVNQRSLPVVLRQPVFHGQQRTNWFYEVTITELKGMALENYRAGVGFVEVTQGKIKFQAFNQGAIRDMILAKVYSRLMLFFFSMACACNIYLMVKASGPFLGSS